MVSACSTAKTRRAPERTADSERMPVPRADVEHDRVGTDHPLEGLRIRVGSVAVPDHSPVVVEAVLKHGGLPHPLVCGSGVQ